MKNRRLAPLLIVLLVMPLISLSFMGITVSMGGKGGDIAQARYEYDPWFDVNDDGLINIVDITIVAFHFGTSGTPMDKATGLLLQLPFGSTQPLGQVDTSAILHSLDLDQTRPGNQQSIFAYKGTTITITGEFQRFQSSGGSGAILQAFFIYSWTPSWPPPDGYYYPLYNGGAGSYPGTGVQSFSFDLTVPDEEGVYYLYFCAGAEYNIAEAVNKYTAPLRMPYAVITVSW